MPPLALAIIALGAFNMSSPSDLRNVVAQAQVWLTQSAWFIDPANVSGNASDTNDGLTALTPLLTHLELETRRAVASLFLGSRFPILQNTTVTLMSGPASPDADPINVDCIGNGFNLIYQGSLTTARSGTLTGTTPAAAGQLWNLTDSALVSWTTDVGHLFTDTVTGARCFINSDLGSHTCLSSEPVAKQNGPVLTFGGGGALTAPGNNAYTVSTMTAWRMGRMCVDHQPTVGNPNIFAVAFYHVAFTNVASSGNTAETVRLLGGDSPNSEAVSFGFTECSFGTSVTFQNVRAQFNNCWFRKFVYALQGSYVVLLAGRAAGSNASNATFLVDMGVLFDCGGGGAFNDNGLAIGAAYMLVGLVSVTNAFAVVDLAKRGSMVTFTQVLHTPQVRGSVTTEVFRLTCGAQVNTAAGWVATFPLTFPAGQFCRADGVYTLSNWIVANQAFDATGPIVVTPALLDAANGAGQFGGYAVNPKTLTSLGTATN